MLFRSTLDQVLNHPAVNPTAVRFIAQRYATEIRDYSKVEAALERLVKVAPDEPEAWFDLAGFKVAVGKAPEALPALRRALGLNARRLQQNPGAPNLLTNLQTDARFTSLRPLPEFQQLLAPK